MKRRKGGAGRGLLENDSRSDVPSKVERQVSRMDIFKKVSREVEVKSASGGLMSILTLLVAISLLISELHAAFVGGPASEMLAVDDKLAERVRIHLNVSFPALRCSLVDIVAMDATGEVQVDVTSTIQKAAIVPEQMRRRNAKGCGDCFGAGDDGRCCDSCAELLEAYSEKGWDAHELLMKQEVCQEERKFEDVTVEEVLRRYALSHHGRISELGCNLSGELEVNKVGGNFHVALGQGKKMNGRLVHKFLPTQLTFFNTSHTIHELWFGSKKLPGQRGGLLEGRSQTVDPHLAQTGAFQYFVELVPTQFRGHRFYRYTVTEQLVLIGQSEEQIEAEFKQLDEERAELKKETGDTVHHIHGHENRQGYGHLRPTVIAQLPGVFFIYDMSPFVIHRIERTVTFFQLLINISGIVGGTVGFTKFLNSLIA